MKKKFIDSLAQKVVALMDEHKISANQAWEIVERREQLAWENENPFYY